MAVWNTIQLSDIHPDRFDAEYFRKDYQDNIALLKETGETTSIGRLFKYNLRGNQPQYHKNGTIKALRSVNVGFMNFNETRQEFVTEEFFKQSSRGKVQKDDILITSTGVGTLGRTSIWFYDENAFCDGHITILRDGVVDPYFITAFLNSKYGLIQFDQNFRGSSGQIEIYPYDISKFVIPECLFPYQEEIGEKVRRAFELQSLSKELYQEATKIFEAKLGLDNSDLEESPNKYAASFNEVILGKRLDAEYFNPRVKEIILRIEKLDHDTINKNFLIKNGFAWKSKKFLNDNSGEPVIRIRDIKPTFIDIKRLTSIESSYASTITFPKAEKGDIVVGMDGLKYFYASILEDDCMVNQRVCHLKPKDNSNISSEYATFIINSKVGQAQLLRDMTIATTVGHITNMNVARLKVPIVSRSFHDEITKMIRESIEADKESRILIDESKNFVENIISQSIEANA